MRNRAGQEKPGDGTSAWGLVLPLALSPTSGISHRCRSHVRPEMLPKIEFDEHPIISQAVPGTPRVLFNTLFSISLSQLASNPSSTQPRSNPSTLLYQGLLMMRRGVSSPPCLHPIPLTPSLSPGLSIHLRLPLPNALELPFPLFRGGEGEEGGGGREGRKRRVLREGQGTGGEERAWERGEGGTRDGGRI